MELLLDSIRSLTHRRPADARLALFIVLGAIKAMLPEDERKDLATTLPMELQLLLLGPSSCDDVDAFEELALVDAHTVEIVCRVLAAGASPAVRAVIGRYVSPQLCGRNLGSRSATDSVGMDAFGPRTVRAQEPTPRAHA